MLFDGKYASARFFTKTNTFSENALFEHKPTSYLLAPAVPPGGNSFSEKVTFANARRTDGRRKNLQSQTQPQSPTPPGKKIPVRSKSLTLIYTFLYIFLNFRAEPTRHPQNILKNSAKWETSQ